MAGCESVICHQSYILNLKKYLWNVTPHFDPSSKDFAGGIAKIRVYFDNCLRLQRIYCGVKMNSHMLYCLITLLNILLIQGCISSKEDYMELNIKNDVVETTEECNSLATCIEVIEHTVVLCQDSIDNDSNDLVDCDDPGCKTFLFCQERLENTQELCQDSVDNDLNSLIDCKDPACGDFWFCTYDAENSEDECQDGVDNDGNTLVDCEDEPCKSFIFCQEPLENTAQQCIDEIDNDSDGLIDCDDEEHCSDYVWCQPPNEDTPAQCADAIDNDGDGLVDCDDEKCKDFTVCLIIENTEFLCSDSIDNDENGLMDCGDPGCADLSICDSREITVKMCTDGKDNDLDGVIDCADPGCQSYAFCTESTNETCSDSLDNDVDGVVDCDDSDCMHLPVCGNNDISCLPKGYEPEDVIEFEMIVYDKNGAEFALTGSQAVGCAGHVAVPEAGTKGMVESKLVNGLPKFLSNNCHNTGIDTWWNSGTSKTVRLPFNHTLDNVYKFQTHTEGFLPLDNCLDGGSWDALRYEYNVGSVCSTPLASRNYGFAGHLHREFMYIEDGAEDQSFEFSGDDDTYVFINGHLILDIGGVHTPVNDGFNFKGAIESINSIALTAEDSIHNGDSITFDFFIAERRAGGSQAGITINMPCLTSAGM